jgi:hypothetical protein
MAVKNRNRLGAKNRPCSLVLNVYSYTPSSKGAAFVLRSLHHVTGVLNCFDEQKERQVLWDTNYM